MRCPTAVLLLLAGALLACPPLAAGEAPCAMAVRTTVYVSSRASMPQ